MTVVSIDHKRAREILASAWEKIDDAGIVPSALARPALDAILGAKDVTFKYLLVTGLLGKCANPKVHLRALQAGSRLKNAYDARSLCHQVVVGFEKEKGNLWGLSNEPFLNKPARHPEHDKANRQLKNKKLAATLHDVLDLAHGAKPDECFAMLVHVLRMSRQRLAVQAVANASSDATYQRVIDFVAAFLFEADGGARLVALAGAFLTLLRDGFEVRVYPPTFSDKFAKTAGDIEIRRDGVLVSASECKHRPLTLSDVQHGIKKAREAGVREYCFIVAEGVAAGQETAVQAELAKVGKEFDVLLIPLQTAAAQWAAVLNPIRRADFGVTVVDLLRNSMKRAGVAEQAAKLWNSLSEVQTGQDASGTSN